MKKKIMNLLIKMFIRETIIFENGEYPNYSNLKDFGYFMINTYHGDFMFKIKEDLNNSVGYNKRHLFPNRLFTIELNPIGDTYLSPRAHYHGKVMLVVKVGGFFFSKKTIINMLVSVYLAQIWKEEKSKITRVL